MNNILVLKTLGVKILKDLPLREDVKVIGYINGFFIYPYSDYWVVQGKMPLKHANELYKFRDSLSIRVAGGANSNKPIEWCTSKEYDEYKNEQSEQIELIGFEEFCERLKLRKKKLIELNEDSFYVGTYHIDKLEGLNKVVETIKKYNIKVEL